MNETGLGTLSRQGDRWTLRFTRRLAHPREKVWRAVTEPEHLAVWYPQEIVGERKAGAPLRFVSSAGDGFDGQMLVFDPPSVMEFTWGTDLLRIELEADGAGTLLTLTDTFDDLGKAARDAAGWHECLDLLASDLDGTSPPAWGQTWRRVHPVYVTTLGPDASAIGPPPGWEEHVRAKLFDAELRPVSRPTAPTACPGLPAFKQPLAGHRQGRRAQPWTAGNGQGRPGTGKERAGTSRDGERTGRNRRGWQARDRTRTGRPDRSRPAGTSASTSCSWRSASACSSCPGPSWTGTR